MSLRVRWADGLWATEVMNFDPELLKVRGMVLASDRGGERERGNDSVRNDGYDRWDCRVCVYLFVCMFECV